MTQPLPRVVKFTLPRTVGLDVEAHGRAVARFEGHGALKEFMALTQKQRRTYGVAARQATKRAQGKLMLSKSGVFGPRTYEGLREANAYDAYADHLLELYAASVESPLERAERLVRERITEFCLLAERNEDAWHYSQARPIKVDVDPRASSVRSDCSGYVIQAYRYARRTTGVDVPDPAKQGWTGYGNTDYYMDNHPVVNDGKYQVGDLAHYRGHVTICRRAGIRTTAVFSSHGTEAGPVPTSLAYRPDLRFVARPPLVGDI